MPTSRSVATRAETRNRDGFFWLKSRGVSGSFPRSLSKFWCYPAMLFCGDLTIMWARPRDWTSYYRTRRVFSELVMWHVQVLILSCHVVLGWPRLLTPSTEARRTMWARPRDLVVLLNQESFQRVGYVTCLCKFWCYPAMLFCGDLTFMWARPRDLVVLLNQESFQRVGYVTCLCKFWCYPAMLFCGDLTFMWARPRDLVVLLNQGEFSKSWLCDMSVQVLMLSCHVVLWWPHLYVSKAKGSCIKYWNVFMFLICQPVHVGNIIFFGPPCGIIFSENSEKISSH